LQTRSLRTYVLAFSLIALLVLAATSAFAADIAPKTYDRSGENWTQYSRGSTVGADNLYPGFASSVHQYGTWNNPFTAGVDAYNYNDNQDYTGLAQGQMLMIWGEELADFLASKGFSSTSGVTMMKPNMLQQYVAVFVPPSMMPGGQGPHGGYSTGTHKCRECHAVHRASGKFKLTRADSRTEACDWCHGDGAGSGYNIQTDNDDAFTKEYNVGHTMGFGTSDGKYKAPDDTYPAYTPKYYMGGFSCFDCHSPHGNPQRLVGYIDYGRTLPKQPYLQAVANGLPHTVSYPDAPDNPSFVKTGIEIPGSMSNPGADPTSRTYLRTPWPRNVRYPDCEVTRTVKVMWPDGTIETTTKPVLSIQMMESLHPNGLTTKPIWLGGTWLLIENPDDQEPFPDYSLATTTFPGDGNSYRVNKVAISWEFPYGTAVENDIIGAERNPNPLCMAVTMSQFCTDCHDGNAGLSITKTPMYSEDRSVRGDALPYDIGYSHDSNPRH